MENKVREEGVKENVWKNPNMFRWPHPNQPKKGLHWRHKNAGLEKYLLKPKIDIVKL